jgi:hypothetical protein
MQVAAVAQVIRTPVHANDASATQARRMSRRPEAGKEQLKIKEEVKTEVLTSRGGWGVARSPRRQCSLPCQAGSLPLSYSRHVVRAAMGDLPPKGTSVGFVAPCLIAVNAKLLLRRIFVQLSRVSRTCPLVQVRCRPESAVLRSKSPVACPDRLVCAMLALSRRPPVRTPRPACPLR